MKNVSADSFWSWTSLFSTFDKTTYDREKVKPGDGYWGDWSSYAYCPPSYRIVGLQTRVMRPQSGDDTALNDVKFTCMYFKTFQGRI